MRTNKLLCTQQNLAKGANLNIEIQNYVDALNDNYLLIVTSNSIEKNAVNKVIANRKNLTVHMSTGGCSIGLLDGMFVVHLTGTSGLSTEHSVSRLVVEFVSRSNIPTPRLVYLVGFCWGNPATTKIGDIIISSTIESLNHRYLEGEETRYKRTQYRSSIDLSFIAQEINREIPNSKLGELGSLETLLSSNSERDSLLQQCPHLIGGEMEAFGFVPSLRQIPWIVIKSVSDFGCDNFERSNQTSSATSSALTLPVLNKLLKDNSLIDFSISKPDELLLLDCLFGSEIRVSRSSINSDELNDHLNDEVGIIIERKLEYYLNDTSYDRSFLRYFCDLILEVLQNSLKHSGASFASVKFHQNKIIINDDGDNFSLENLKGDNGGASSWRRIKSYGLDTNLLSYSFKKKSHYFEMNAASKELMEAVKNCKASIVPSTIGSGYGRQVALSYKEGCEIIYLEDSNVRMTSRRIVLIGEVKRLLEEGKKVYVKVSDNAYAEEYRLALKEYSDNLRILTE